VVVLWHLQVTANQVWDNIATSDAPTGVPSFVPAIPVAMPAQAQPITKIHSALQPFTFQVDINHQLQNDPGSDKVTYGYSSDRKDFVGSTLLMDSAVAPTGSSVNSTDYAFARNIATCEPDTGVIDPGAASSQNTFLFSAMADIPVVETVSAQGGPPKTNNTDTPIGVQFSIPYDYSNPSPHGTLSPSDLPFGVVHSMMNLPEGTGTPSASLNQIQYQLTMKSLQLNYEISDMDNLLDASVTALPSFQEVGGSRYVATDGSLWIVHGNNRVSVLVDGQDVSTQFNTLRYHNAFTAPLSSTKPANSNSNKKKFPSGDWVGDTQVQVPSWADVPGAFLEQQPGKWPSERYVEEFVTLVSKFPEFGGLYYNVTVDTVPGSFRVFMSGATQITINQWCTIKQATSPFKQPNPGTAIFDSGWQPAPS
jgi:hypothetical protein